MSGGRRGYMIKIMREKFTVYHMQLGERPVLMIHAGLMRRRVHDLIRDSEAMSVEILKLKQ